MSFSSLLEEANQTLDSNYDTNDTQWSIDSNNSSTTLPSPRTPAPTKHGPQASPFHAEPNLNNNFTGNRLEHKTGPLTPVQHFNNFQNNSTFHEVKAEPNPFYTQSDYQHQFVNQIQYHQPMIQQRTHLPIQFDEFYNMNSLPRQEYIINNHNHQQPYHHSQKPLTNILPQNVKTEKNRKRPNKKSEPRKKIKIEFKGAPQNWRALYDNIMEMRNNIVAPVDVMGCFKNAESDKGPKTYRYQVMISLMLSSQTKDEVTSGAMDRLKKYGLTPKHISDTEESVLAQLIHPVGFWQKKATYIKNASRIVHTEYEDDIPKTVEGLTSLPGIGPKMAHLCMEFAWNKLTGISVDTHVHRICQRIGWTPTGIKQPDDTRKLLEHWLPKEEWGRINLMMVGFGQVICLPTKPRCFECKNKEVCPYAMENPDRTNKKASQDAKPSARNLKNTAADTNKINIKCETKDESKAKDDKKPSEQPSYVYHNPYQRDDTSSSTPTTSSNGTNGPKPAVPKSLPLSSTPVPYNPPTTQLQGAAMSTPANGSCTTTLLTPPLQPPRPELPQSLRVPKAEPHYNMYNYNHHFPTPPSFVKVEPPSLPPHDTSPHPASYQTLTPTASPHCYDHAQLYHHHHPPTAPFHHFPGFYNGHPHGPFPGALGAVRPPAVVSSPCVQSPMIDTTTSSPLINPLCNTNPTETNKLSTELNNDNKSTNVLENFLDW